MKTTLRRRYAELHFHPIDGRYHRPVGSCRPDSGGVFEDCLDSALAKPPRQFIEAMPLQAVV